MMRVLGILALVAMTVALGFWSVRLGERAEALRAQEAAAPVSRIETPETDVAETLLRGGDPLSRKLEEELLEELAADEAPFEEPLLNDVFATPPLDVAPPDLSDPSIVDTSRSPVDLGGDQGARGADGFANPPPGLRDAEDFSDLIDDEEFAVETPNAIENDAAESDADIDATVFEEDTPTGADTTRPDEMSMAPPAAPSLRDPFAALQPVDLSENDADAPEADAAAQTAAPPGEAARNAMSPVTLMADQVYFFQGNHKALTSVSSRGPDEAVTVTRNDGDTFALSSPYEVMPARWVLSEVEAAYPANCGADAARREIVTVRFRVDNQGRAPRPIVTSASNDCFAAAAVTAVRAMEFRVRAPAGRQFGDSMFLLSVAFEKPAA